MARQTTQKKAKDKKLTPKEKIQAGEVWRFNFIPDADVANKIIEEYEKSPNGAEYNKIINSRLRKAYK